jgi:hypothetical protein
LNGSVLQWIKKTIRTQPSRKEVKMKAGPDGLFFTDAAVKTEEVKKGKSS